jgi:glycosyltransferase involved in cell wall biosynthesis
MTQNSKLPSLSVFMPAYNEAGNIREAIKQVLAVAPKVAHKYEVIVINDGSKDGTGAIAGRMAEKYPQVKVINQRNKGYGGAVKRGFKEAKYEWVFFTDSDLQFDVRELVKFVEKVGGRRGGAGGKDGLDRKVDMVLGYRIKRAEGFKRVMLARALKTWNRMFLAFPMHIKDIDCAFKLIHRPVLDRVLPLYSDGAMVSTELLLKAHRYGYKCVQIGVHHYERRTGKPTGNNYKVIYKAVRDTFVLQKLLIVNSETIKATRNNVKLIKQFSDNLWAYVFARE